MAARLGLHGCEKTQLSDEALVVRGELTADARWEGITDQLTRLAEAQAVDGMLDEALGTIEEALQANPEELVFRPNVLTYRGELWFKLSQPELAEAHRPAG